MTQATPPNTPQSSSQAILRKFDRESATRIWTGLPSTVVRWVVSVFSLWCLWSTLFSVADMRIRLSSFLGAVVIMGYITYPASRKHVRPNTLPWYDILLMTLGAFCFFYYATHFSEIAFSVSSASKLNPFNAKAVSGAWFYVSIGVVGFLVVCELCRRCVGLPILCVCSVLLIYALVKKGLWDVVYTMFYTTEGLMGTPIQVCAKFIAVFIIFGAFLERTGISSFFIDLANSIAGGSSGGPAKVAVISSALCGVVSGSSVGNTVTTGSVTIPMMKKTGYPADFAGAVEAAASTGGQIMPPIMGAAAFLMSDYMGISYGRVALYAILPAILYFTGIFIAVHLEAKKLGLKGASRSELPQFTKLLHKTYLLIPIVLLVAMVASQWRTMQFSAALAIVAAIVVSIPGILRTSLADSSSLPANERLQSVAHTAGKKLLGMVFSSLEGGGRGCITVAVACAIAGTVAGSITVTGLASRLVSGVVRVSSLIPNKTFSMLVALFLTMLSCIVLGMGVPTTANYCIMASTCAPILIQLGVPVVAAHFFVFYFGIIADITPPVALAAYAGSAIAQADPMKTGVNATKLAIAAFIVPYIFCLDPSMLLFNKGFVSAVLVIITSLIGLFSIASGLIGYVFAPMPLPLRIVAFVAGIAMMVPGVFTDLAGLVVVAAILILQRKKATSEAT